MTALENPVTPASRPDRPVTGAGLWNAADLERRQDWRLELTEAEIAEIEAAAASTRARGLPISAITVEDFEIRGLGLRLRALRETIRADLGVGYVRGLPVDRYDRDTLLRIYWGLSRHIGDPVTQNRNAHLLGHVIDIGNSVEEHDKRITQTNAELCFHTDSCDVVGLLCVRTAMRGGESAIVSGVAVHNEMMLRDRELWRTLYEPVVLDRRGEIPPGKLPWFQMPVFTWSAGVFNAYAPVRQYVESARRFAEAPPLTTRQGAALDLFYAICGELAVRIPFRAGDMQFLHNHLVFHSRTAYEDWPDPARKRHLIRIWLSLRDGRVLPEVFGEKWPIIAVGTVRGGVRSARPPVIPLEPETPAYS